MYDMITVILAAQGIYAGIGFFFAIVFVTKAVDRIDHNARGTGFGFRLMILPGAAAFWPVLLWRWIRGTPPPEEHNAHRDVAKQAV